MLLPTVVDGLLAAAQAPDIEGHTLDVGSGQLVSIRTVVEHLVGLIDPQIEPAFGALVLHFRNENQADFPFPRLFTGDQL